MMSALLKRNLVYENSLSLVIGQLTVYIALADSITWWLCGKYKYELRVIENTTDYLHDTSLAAFVMLGSESKYTSITNL